VIDFSPFRKVRYDAAHGIVEVEPGARLADVDRELCPRAQVLPLGTVSDTGIAGLALGGGIGWLIGRYGLTCDHLIGADVVLADGRLVRAEDHPELLWAMRGGGGNFGVVLRFRFQTRPLPTVRVGSGHVPREAAGEALVRLAQFLSTSCPPELTVAPLIHHGEAGTILDIDYCLAENDDCAAQAHLEVLRTAVPMAAWNAPCGKDFVAWQSASDHLFAPPMRGYWKARYAEALPERDIEAVLATDGCAVGARRTILIEHLHGAFCDPGAAERSAFPLRWARFGILISSRWASETDDRQQVDWVRAVHGALTPMGRTGTYSNYTPADEAGCGSVYNGAIGVRLAAIKETVDPGNLFRRNHNIRPRAAMGAHAPAFARESAPMNDWK
jgi:FAD/FMN-containing dehydrogenase